MLGLGVQEMLFILGAALLLFGPRKLPEIGRTLGKGLAEFRRASAELKRSLDTEMIEEELRDSKQALDSVNPRRFLEEATGRMDPQRVSRGPSPSPPAEPVASPDELVASPDEAPAEEASPDTAGDDDPAPATAADGASSDVAGETGGSEPDDDETARAG